MYNPLLGSIKLNPRPYQTDHVYRIIRQVVKDRVICAQLATGGGKTVEFSMICSRFINKTGKSVLILVHRHELLTQCQATLANMFAITAGLITAGVDEIPQRRVYIGMVESVNRRVDMLPLDDIGMVIIDECHTEIFHKMHYIFPTQYIIGFTATPKGVSKKNPLKNFYKSIVVCKEDIPELVKDGYLSRNVTKCPTEVIDAARLRILAGEYDMSQMAQEFSKQKFVMNTVKYYVQFSEGKKTIVFNVNVEHSKEVTNCFTFCGYPCKHVDGTTPEAEREQIFKWFKETENAILCNVGITTMGFDEPTVETIIVNRCTKSMPLWLQMCGRGSRIIDDAFIAAKQKDYPYQLKKKNRFTIIDMGGNHVEHGDWSDARDWEDIFYNPDPPGRPGIAPVKTCPDCRGLVHAATAICVHIKEDGEKCLHIFNRRAAKEQEELGELIVVSKNINYFDIMEISKKENRKPYYTFFELGRQIVNKMRSFNRTLSGDEVNKMFNIYFEQIQDWHKVQFPGERFTYDHHLKLARQHFDSCLKQKFQRIS